MPMRNRRVIPISALPWQRQRHAAIVIALLAIPVIEACGDADQAGEGQKGIESTVNASVAAKDPCSLIPISEWERQTGYTDIRADRSDNNTCDMLSDDLWGVVGSVIFPGRAMFEHPPAMAGETESIADLGDEAFWLSLGPIVRTGEQFIWITVNPKVDDQRRVALDLARTAVANR
jgi:hypothetical protein